jgi:hypothetical protein
MTSPSFVLSGRTTRSCETTRAPDATGARTTTIAGTSRARRAAPPPGVDLVPGAAIRHPCQCDKDPDEQ